MEELEAELFVKEMKILWQNSIVDVRNQLNKIIRDYFGYHTERADKIINTMQTKI